MLDMQVTEDDISELLQRITTATYNVDGYYLGESSQGLGYSNMIYMHLQLKEYEKGVDPLKVNMFFLEEPESHMHPQMQQVFIKYLLDYYHTKLQGLITTHEILREKDILNFQWCFFYKGVIAFETKRYKSAFNYLNKYIVKFGNMSFEAALYLAKTEIIIKKKLEHAKELLLLLLF